MLEKVQLDNFLSHSSTELRLDKGVTVFIGKNGAGKSSIIDAITFALYGEHTRGNNRNLVRRGSQGSIVQLVFTADSKRYIATRNLDAKGTLAGAKLELVTDSEIETIAHGERKQMDESMSRQVAEIIGLDYERLKVAAVVQQGELDTILKSDPSEFKELINALIGIERLDKAFKNMLDVIEQFRSLLRKRTGYDDTDLETLKLKIGESSKQLKDSSLKLQELHAELEALKAEERKIRQRLDVLEPLSTKEDELEDKELDLLSYVKQKSKDMKEKMLTLEQATSDAADKLKEASKLKETHKELEQVRQEIGDLELDVQYSENEAGRLEGFHQFSREYLQPKDGKCPVCGSRVTDLKVKLSPEHIRQDLERFRKKADAKRSHLKKLRDRQRNLTEIEASAKAASKFLAAVGIRSQEDISRKEAEAKRIRKDLAGISAVMNIVKDPRTLAIDDYSHELASKITTLRKDLTTFDRQEYDSMLQKHRQIVDDKIPSLAKEIGSFEATNRQQKEELDKMQGAVKELEKAGAYINLLERIRKGVYNRDGSVAMSLRSWALRMISQKASEYIFMFNVNVSRVELAEKARKVIITCYGPRGDMDMESLSGGEKVAIALALRLGMAYVMGHGRLDFVILDEPTTHLDEERRKSLVRIITEAFRSGLGPLLQMVIITHDAEIFEGAEVDSIYKFEMTAEGTSVTRL